ncbi:hypothetical protein GCM10011415_15350 [Salipiger pallidus]|uniref:Uncharacterized protein n=1 Tax=Salipiger pallidus TaxID=1775170 RepID=A0A8J2ZIZ9_9RHOB|nr:hypothetical protein [Salipiger pallidus]GGG68969.1 hypothetical protein GCM10011415_15350 [Salipiger pallidus]
MRFSKVADGHPCQRSRIAPGQLHQLPIANFSPRNKGSIGKAMSPKKRCMQLAPPLAAGRGNKDDAGSNAACRTVSGN